MLCTILFAGTLTAGILRGLSLVTALRAAIPRELRGIDLSEHGEHAYHDGDTSEEIAGEGVVVGQPVLLERSDESEPRRLTAA